MTFLRTDLFVAPSETELFMLLRQILIIRIPLQLWRECKVIFSISLTDDMLFRNHRQQFGQGHGKTAPQIWRRIPQIYAENIKFNIGHGVYYSGLRLYSSDTRTNYPFPSGWLENKRLTLGLTAKLFKENFPLKSSARFRYCSIVLLCRAVKPSYNYSLFFQCVPAENRSLQIFLIPNP